MSYLSTVPPDEKTTATFDVVHQTFGFVPNFFKAQTMRTDLIEAELQLVGTTLVAPGALTRQEKEYIFLTCSAAAMSTYCVTAHCEIVRMLKLEGPEPEQVAVDHASTNLPMAFKALLNFGLKLSKDASKIQKSDIEGLRKFGYTDQQIMEAIVVVGVAHFANVVSFGLGTVPDFEPVVLAVNS